jgi:hypothetical protein
MNHIEDFSLYFDLSKEELKILIEESQMMIDEIKCRPAAKPSTQELKDEEARLRALKLALCATDANASLNTFEDRTLDVNFMYPSKNKFTFDFRKYKRSAENDHGRSKSSFY